LYDVLVWDKKLVQVNTINYVGALLSLFVFFIPRILSMISTKRVTTEPAYKKISMQTKKRKIAK
jgi:hypothetical protein